MPCSAVQVAKRALVALIHALALVYHVEAKCTRNSPDEEVVRAFRKLVLKVHPDRGGNDQHQQQLNEARSSWEAAKKKPRKAQNVNLPVISAPSSFRSSRNEFRIQATAVLLTYQGLVDCSQWLTLNAFVVDNLRPWKVKHWCTTLETCSSGMYHAHVMLQFSCSVDKTAAAFAFHALKPNVSPTDLCGEGLCRKKVAGQH